MKYKYLLFDLDGTLNDSAPGITNAVRYALDRFGFHDQPDEKVKKFIGPPLLTSFQEYYGFSKEDALKGIMIYREYYDDKGKFECEIYEGIMELLRDLKAAGYKLIICTAKPEMFTFPIVEHFGLNQYFDFVAGALDSEERSEKHEVIKYIMEEVQGITKDNAIMIGDRKHDIEGANINGLDSIGVLYGYGNREELEKAGATYILENVVNIREMFL